MTNTEAVFFWMAVWVYGMSFVSFLYGVAFKKEKWLRAGWYMAIGGFVPQTISMAVRWLVIGHPPVMRVYENSMLSSWFIVVLFMALRYWHRKTEAIGVAVIPVVLLMLGNGIMSRPYLEPLSPPFKSNWLWLHVFFAWIAYGAFCVAAGLGVAYLLKERAERGRGSEVEKLRSSRFYGMLPDLMVLNDLMLRVVIFGFMALTVEIGAGAIWAHGLWGRYWGWDPVETWSLITWLIYGIDIHLGVTLGWKGRRMAWLVILSLISLFIAFGGIGYISGVHTPIL
jgi:cytochrome c-type biogenesis protein CcsB